MFNKGMAESKLRELVAKPFCLIYVFQLKPNDKFLDWSILKVFADDKIRVENIVGKGENAG